MRLIQLTLLVLFGLTGLNANQETLPPLVDGKVPATFEELWRGYLKGEPILTMSDL
jgi:hypothetical protein